MKKLLIVLLIGFASCSLFDGMKKNSFAYSEREFLPLFVPKGFRKSNVQTDSSGNRRQTFFYQGGGELYFYVGDSTRPILPIDTAKNIPKYYPGNVRYYKGQDNSGSFWRENQYKNFRFGYRNVSAEREAFFDSSINYAAWQLLN